MPVYSFTQPNRRPFHQKTRTCIDKPSRRRIANAVAEIDGLISSGEVLQSGGFQFPPATSEAIPELLPQDAMDCDASLIPMREANVGLLV